MTKPSLRRRAHRLARWIAPFALGAAALIACGDNIEGIPTEILPESVYANRCVSPRSGVDPISHLAFPDMSGSLLDEKLWVRSWIDDLYLWYQEVPDVDIRAFSKTTDYFDQLRTPAKTPSGKDKDQFHFFMPTADWEAQSQSGVEAGYGVTWALLATRPPRSLLVAYVTPGSPAQVAGLGRGDKVISIDGVDLQNGSDVDTLNEGLYPTALNAKHRFVVIKHGASASTPVDLTSATIDITPVQHIAVLPQGSGDKVGYFIFTDHIATAQKQLIDAVNQLRTAGINDLVIDIRYNGGGFLAIAAQLAYMIAGPTATAGKTFEQLTFNDKQPPDPPSGFLNVTVDLSADMHPDVPPGQPLPYLGKTRVFVLTGSGTCSASESVMNSLAGIDVQVIQIGATTCGKPYGFLPADNCGTTFFAIQFKGVNNKGFGDYADGFVPGQLLPGCAVDDDFDHALGDPAEARLAAALTYRTTSACPPPPTHARSRSVEPVIPKPLWRQNRIVRR